jgi:GT2 family glycosyltransferase
VPRLGIVMVTRDRRENVLRSLARLRGLPVCVVDNASADGTAGAVRESFPEVDVVRVDTNLGAGGRNLGARRLGCDLTAFADDDSWWALGSLSRAIALFDAYPSLALIAGRVLVGPACRLDPVCADMRTSPVPARHSLPGPAVLGFVACGAIVRTAPYLAVGGFDARYGVGGEERRLALDLAAAGWDLAYADDVIAHHHPAPSGRPGRRWREVRNDLWSDWLRRPAPAAAASTARRLAGAPPADGARGFVEAARGLPWVLRERRVVPAHVERALAALDSGRYSSVR